MTYLLLLLLLNNIKNEKMDFTKSNVSTFFPSIFPVMNLTRCKTKDCGSLAQDGKELWRATYMRGLWWRSKWVNGVKQPVDKENMSSFIVKELETEMAKHDISKSAVISDTIDIQYYESEGGFYGLKLEFMYHADIPSASLL